MFTAHAAKVDTVSVFSARMQKAVKTVVVLPEQQQIQSVLYLLHGYSGNYSNWVNNVSSLKDLVDQYGYVVVCPDGGFDSWYWDTTDDNYKYETFITKELIPFIEDRYTVGNQRVNRGITGLSMGGHGALYLAFRHQDLFAFAGSTSGGVDIRPFPENWNMKQRLGTYHENKKVWDDHTVIELTHLVQAGNLQLFIDCGTDDFFFAVNNKLHEKLDYLRIPHVYLTMPGKHDWNYWSQSIAYQMAFFEQCFLSASKIN
ncbi:hypothetical protein GCM10017764_01040 [Sphingobacterium griseoflavum]|uniref:XynC protein n=2 Tax=Sphingobacterium griseoflavum TaxID=1474952 RepID=A0ABQ3HPI1_9SPHI|nr:hypothetical protein GCM10017764_01040 [Sphingobacterium griseoflavum]